MEPKRITSCSEFFVLFQRRNFFVELRRYGYQAQVAVHLYYFSFLSRFDNCWLSVGDFSDSAFFAWKVNWVRIVFVWKVFEQKIFRNCALAKQTIEKCTKWVEMNFFAIRTVCNFWITFVCVLTVSTFEFELRFGFQMFLPFKYFMPRFGGENAKQMVGKELVSF